MRVRLLPSPLPGAVVMACVLAVTAAAQVPKQQKPTARLTGQVVSDDGKAVAGTRISAVRLFLAGPGEEWPHAWPVESDARGLFSLPGLPPGPYSLEVAAAPGFVRPRPLRVDLKGGRTSQLTIRLKRTGTISGQVFGAGGRPFGGGSVHVLASDPLSETGWRDTSLGLVKGADARFRVAVPPGDYYVLADPPRAPFAGSLPSKMGYGSTYYPGVTLNEARLVNVRSGEETSGIDVNLLSVPLADITVSAVDSAGHPLAATDSVTINPVLNILPTRFSAIHQPDGTFLASGVPPGDYYLAARVGRAGKPQTGGEQAFLRTRVAGEDLAVHLQTNGGATVSGRVLVERARTGTNQPLTGQSVKWVGDLLMGPPVDPARSSAQTDSSGSFELTGLRGSGFLWLTASPLVLRTLTLGGRDVTGVPVEFAGTEQLHDVVVVLTSRTARVRGTVTGLDGAPTDASVLLFPDDPDQWSHLSPRVTIVSARAGTFEVPAVLPGRYYIAAVETVSPHTGRLALQRLRPRATRLVLNEGKTTSVTLKVGR